MEVPSGAELLTTGRQFEKLEALYAGNGKHVAAAIFHKEADHCRRLQRQTEAAASTRRAKEEEEARKEGQRMEKLKQISECAPSVLSIAFESAACSVEQVLTMCLSNDAAAARFTSRQRSSRRC